MFIILLFMFAGILSGYLLRKIRIGFVNGVILTLIWLLLFLLGLEVGFNNEVIARFPVLGLESVVVAVFATLGSISGARILLPPAGMKIQEEVRDKQTVVKSISGMLNGLKGSLIILAFFVAGLLLSVFAVLPESILPPKLSFYVLQALMFSVGFSIGHQPETIKQFRRIKSRVLLLPLMTIAGTWFGALLAGLFSRYSVTDMLAVSSGFGYYSLSGIMITEYRGAELGTVALLANIVREILTLLLAPLMVRYFGQLAPVSAGGATTMDTTFPIIMQTSGREFAVVSIYHGFVMDFSVPFLVSLWCLW
ncbi:MAG: lysine exporter LysO family protein [Paludibacteraceae bacterium]|nr:lysine exporter LysO family protein [Paludibacteraceae bacterium]